MKGDGQLLGTTIFLLTEYHYHMVRMYHMVMVFVYCYKQPNKVDISQYTMDLRVC